MFEYARADTHYLLYVYDRLRVDLIEVGNGQPGLLQLVWNKSKDISLKVRHGSQLENVVFEGINSTVVFPHTI